MKRINNIILLATALTLSSCHYLDIAPEQGINEEEVFGKYVNFKGFFDKIIDQEVKGNEYYNVIATTYQTRMDANTFRFTITDLTDLADAGRQGLRCESAKAGVLGENCEMFFNTRVPLFDAGWFIIRTINICIEKIDMLEDAQEDEKYDLLAQAYFFRAWMHMNLCQWFGGQPYLDHSLTGEESWDLPRESAKDTYLKCAADFDKAYEYFQKCGRVRRDPFPGETGHLLDINQSRPNGVAALALKGRALLFAASPLNNPENDRQLWEDAAVANAIALKTALEYKYELLDFDHWADNLGNVQYTNEQIWAYYYGNYKSASGFNVNKLGFPITNGATGGGENPTQNAVDLFETVWGDPLETEEDRAAAEKAGHYDPQDPYQNLDPRFYEKVIYDGCPGIGINNTTGDPSEVNQVRMYFDLSTGTYPVTTISGKNRNFGVKWNSEQKSYTTTGYYSHIRWDGKYTGTSHAVTDPLIRLSEVYLNYAEAANMAGGPSASYEGQITALEAVNTIRHRARMPDVKQEFTGDREKLNRRIQNERTVEFMFENHHYYHDIRRWKTAPERMKAVNYGMYVEKGLDGKKTYMRKPILHTTAWKDAMYYWYLPKEEAMKYKNYTNNEAW